MFIRTLSDGEEAAGHSKPYVLVDGGDLLPRLEEHPTLYAEFFAEAINRMGYDALNLGEMEFWAGRAVIKRMSEVAEFSLISSNALSDDPLWEPYVIKEIKDVRVAILGLLSPRFPIDEGIAIVEAPKVCLERVLNDLKDTADIFVLLSHMDKKTTLDLVQDVPGVDVAVVGHGSRNPIEGERVGKTLVISPGLKGQHVGVIDIAWDGGQEEVVGMTSKIHPLGSDIPDDTGFAEVIREFNRKINAARDEEYRQRQAQEEEDQRTKALVERALKMTPEEFYEFYQKEMQDMLEMPESQKVQP